MSRVALITGGGQGVGAAIAKQFLDDGFSHVVLLDRNAEALKFQQQQLGADKVTVVAADLLDPSAPMQAVETTMAKYGRIDVLVNAAGNTERCSVDDVSLDAYDRLFDINVKAPLFLMQAAGKVMKTQGSGVVINISSMLAHGGPSNIGIYAASKAALVGLTKNVANTWKRDGIRVFAINLGWVNSEGEHQLQTGFHKLPIDWAEAAGKRMPFGRLILPEDVAGLCGFLVSPPAQMMTGTIIDFDQMPIGVYDAYPHLAPE